MELVVCSKPGSSETEIACWMQLTVDGGQNGAQKQVQKITCSFELVNLFDFICIRPRWKSDITPEPIDSIFQLQEYFDSKFII